MNRRFFNSLAGLFVLIFLASAILGTRGQAPSTDDLSLLAFFQARSRTAIDRDHLHVLLRQFAAGSQEERRVATAELLGLGPLALPVLRHAVNDLDHPQAARRAARCLPWLE